MFIAHMRPGRARLAWPVERAETVSKIRKYTENIWNVPNVLTMLRLALIPVFVAVFAAGHDKLALMTFVIASLTDLLDGHLARKHHQITAFGKLMVVTALICQGVKSVFPWQAIAIVMLKELVMIVGGVFMLHHDIVVYSNIRGKLAQFSFILALILSFWHSEFTHLPVPLDRVVLWVAVVLALVALVDYSVDSYRKLRALYREKKQQE